ncbi:MAG: AzlD domain-containing protein [Neisseriaceae bacterium]|nr:AzlD domain-containing protein [Neisseriaceae bacterium]MBR7059139.1 AzlD domain-containing protein [Neisseriaceae bacterium]
MAASIATILTRFLPYWIFKKQTNNITLLFLQKNTGLMIMLVLTIYALYSMGFSISERGIILSFCLIVTAILHLWKKNFLLSISIPTILCIILFKIFSTV